MEKEGGSGSGQILGQPFNPFRLHPGDPLNISGGEFFYVPFKLSKPMHPIISKGCVVELFLYDHMGHSQSESPIGSRSDPDPPFGLFRGMRFERIDHHHPGPSLFRL